MGSLTHISALWLTVLVLCTATQAQQQEQSSDILLQSYQVRYQYELSTTTTSPVPSIYLIQVRVDSMTHPTSQTVDDRNQWQLKLFLSPRHDGSGSRVMISNQLLNTNQSSTYVGPSQQFSFVADRRFNVDDFGPGSPYPYICTEMTTTPWSTYQLNFNGRSAISCSIIQQDVLPRTDRIPHAIVRSVNMGFRFSDTDPYDNMVDTGVNYDIRFNGCSDAIEGGTSLWRLRLFASQNRTGTGSQIELSAQMLDDDQMTYGVTPGGLLEFSGIKSIDLTGIGTDSNYPYICISLETNHEADIKLVYRGLHSVLGCQRVPRFQYTPKPNGEIPIGSHQVIVEQYYTRISVAQADPTNNVLSATVQYHFRLGPSVSPIRGDTPLWQLTLFASQNNDGTGSRKMIFPQLLDQEQVYAAILPREVISFTARERFEAANIGPGTNMPYICSSLNTHPQADFELVSGEDHFITTCEELLPYSVSQDELKNVSSGCCKWSTNTSDCNDILYRRKWSFFREESKNWNNLYRVRESDPYHQINNSTDDITISSTLLDIFTLYRDDIERQPETGPTLDIPNPQKEVHVNRECDRTCTEGDIRTCIFDWEVSYYYTMLSNINGHTGRPCGDCPFNQTDCSNEECVTLNGLARPVVTVNKQVPGPKIIVCRDDTIIVNVKNLLNDMTGITFHWHGMNQFHTPAMDGPSMITQCPIPFATTFTYKIKANEPGTYFWHSHIGSNRADGLAGPIVIREVNDPHSDTYDVDDSSHTVVIQDWMNITQNSNYMKYMYDAGISPPDFLLINGKDKGPAYQNEGTGSFFVPREVFHVESSLRYRIRIISNAFTSCQMRVSIDNHTLLAITIDSRPINPVPFDALISNAGERFDIILHANQSIGNYWFRLVGVGNNCTNLQALAIIRYKDAPVEDPSAPERSVATPHTILNVPQTSTVTAPKIIKLSDLTSLSKYAPDTEINRYYLPLGIETPRLRDTDLRGGKGIPQINHITFTFPPVPLLTQHSEVDQSLFCDAREAGTWTNCTDVQCKCTQIISVELNQIVELFLYSAHKKPKSCHPMHLHGFSYRIVGMGSLNTTGDSPAEIQRRDEQGDFPRLRTNYPPNKDTACVSEESYMIIQFKAYNPGWWFFHCHLDFHALIGMAMVVRVGTDEDLRGLIPDNFPRCSNFAPPGV